MTNVVLIGTCRILHPIKTLEDINILNEPDLPFVHNTSEVIQRLNYLQGNYSYPSELSSYQLNGQPPSLIPNVIEFSEINNAEYINPTELFHQYPQEIVLDKNGEDINHYNKEFIPTVGKYFSERIAMKRD